MKKIATVLVLILIGFGLALIQAKREKVQKIHYHAGFQVYKDDKLVNFSDLKYMDVKPCTVSGKAIDSGNDQLEKAHLHDLVGDVVHVHRNNAIWADLFKNIKYDVPKGSQGYVNGQKTSDILTYPIKPYDSVIIFIGSHKDIKEYLPKAVSKAHIQDIEKHSEACGAS